MGIKFDDKLPIYVQVANIIKKQIVSGTLKGGDKLLSVREFSSELKVNPNTVQRAYQELDKDGFTFTQRGMGTFVKDDEERIINLRKQMAADVVKYFIKEMKELGFNSNEINEVVGRNLKGEGNINE